MTHNVLGDQAPVIALCANNNEMRQIFDKDDNGDLLESSSVRLALLSMKASVHDTHENQKAVHLRVTYLSPMLWLQYH